MALFRTYTHLAHPLPHDTLTRDGTIANPMMWRGGGVGLQLGRSAPFGLISVQSRAQYCSAILQAQSLRVRHLNPFPARPLATAADASRHRQPRVIHVNRKDEGSKWGEEKKDEERDTRKRRRRMMLWRFFGFVTWIPVLAAFLLKVGSLGAITGASMSPTLNPEADDKDIVVLNRLAAGLLRFNIGDVVMLVSPADPHLMICKRILAMPGDTVSFHKPGGKPMRVRIPPYHVWVEGDRSVMEAKTEGGRHAYTQTSRDSREYGPVGMRRGHGTRTTYI